MNAINRNEQRALARAVLEIDVNNHAGVMSHVVGLFSRRAYNVEGILVMPVGDGSPPLLPAPGRCRAPETRRR